MELDFHILNQKGSPAIYQDIFANRPSAGFTGRLFVSTDTDELYRDNGTGWDLIGGGGGGAVGDGISILGAGTVGSPFNTGLDAVLAIGQALSANRVFKFNNKNVEFTDNKITQFKLASTGATVFDINDTTSFIKLGFQLDSMIVFSKSAQLLQSYINNKQYGFSINDSIANFYSGDVSIDSEYCGLELTKINALCNLTSTAAGDTINLLVDGINLKIQSNYNSLDIGLYIDFSNLDYSLGDGSGTYNFSSGFTSRASNSQGYSRLFSFDNINGYNLIFSIDSNNPKISTLYNSIDVGLILDYINQDYFFGDYDPIGSGINRSYLRCLPSSSEISLNCFDSLANNNLSFLINGNSDYFVTTRNSSEIGLKLEYQTEFYGLGDFNAVLRNNAYLYIDGANKNLHIGTNELEFDSIAIITGSAGGSSGQHLIIKVAGNTYKIALLNP